MSVTDSQKDLVSVEAISKTPSGAVSTLWTKQSTKERKLVAVIAAAILICLGLVVALVVVSSNTSSFNIHDQTAHQSALTVEADICLTQGCVGEYCSRCQSHTIFKNQKSE